MTRRLAIVVSTAPERGDIDTAADLARAARSRGVEVMLFFMDEAVRGLPPRRAAIDRLAELGCDLIACATSAAALKLEEAELGVELGSQDDHAAMLQRAQRLLAFT